MNGTVLHCPNCKEVGHVIRFDDLSIHVHMRCPKCTYRWKTLSKICPKCERMNGYAVEGVCKSCYSQHIYSK